MWRSFLTTSSTSCEDIVQQQSNSDIPNELYTRAVRRNSKMERAYIKFDTSVVLCALSLIFFGLCSYPNLHESLYNVDSHKSIVSSIHVSKWRSLNDDQMNGTFTCINSTIDTNCSTLNSTAANTQLDSSSDIDDESRVIPRFPLTDILIPCIYIPFIIISSQRLYLLMRLPRHNHVKVQLWKYLLQVHGIVLSICVLQAFSVLIRLVVLAGHDLSQAKDAGMIILLLLWIISALAAQLLQMRVYSLNIGRLRALRQQIANLLLAGADSTWQQNSSLSLTFIMSIVLLCGIVPSVVLTAINPIASLLLIQLCLAILSSYAIYASVTHVLAGRGLYHEITTTAGSASEAKKYVTVARKMYVNMCGFGVLFWWQSLMWIAVVVKNDWYVRYFQYTNVIFHLSQLSALFLLLRQTHEALNTFLGRKATRKNRRKKNPLIRIGKAESRKDDEEDDDNNALSTHQNRSTTSHTTTTRSSASSLPEKYISRSSDHTNTLHSESVNDDTQDDEQPKQQQKENEQRELEFISAADIDNDIHRQRHRNRASRTSLMSIQYRHAPTAAFNSSASPQAQRSHTIEVILQPDNDHPIQSPASKPL